MKVYNNPDCSKCVATLALLNEQGVEPEIINYLDTPPSKEELKEILHKLRIDPLDLIRKKESLFIENYEGKSMTDEVWIQVMIQHPILIERPIIIDGNAAIIGRPPTKVLDLLNQ